MSEKKKEETEGFVVEMGTPVPVEMEIPTPDPEPKKKKKTRAPRKKKGQFKELEQNISLLLLTLSNLAAARDPIWKLSEDEVKAVADPSSRILGEMGLSDEANEKADYVMLFFAVAGIMLPRILMLKARGGSKKDGARQPQRAPENNHGPADGASPRGIAGGNVKQLLPGLV